KMYGGSNISVPAIEEIEYYKQLINEPSLIENAYCQNLESPEHYIYNKFRKRLVGISNEINIKDITTNFCKVAFMLTDEEEEKWRKTRKRPEKLRKYLQKQT
ncbi:MAG: hypothetical protein PHX51_08440, partial [Clostridia bacterium]|nr:hypothetical protein [Clostridia bacterium]